MKGKTKRQETREKRRKTRDERDQRQDQRQDKRQGTRNKRPQTRSGIGDKGQQDSTRKDGVGLVDRDVCCAFEANTVLNERSLFF